MDTTNTKTTSAAAHAMPWIRGMVLALALPLGLTAADAASAAEPAAAPTPGSAATAPAAVPPGVDPTIWRSLTTGTPAYGADSGFWQSVINQPNGGG